MSYDIMLIMLILWSKFLIRVADKLAQFLLIEVPLQLLGAIVLFGYIPYQNRKIVNNPTLSWKLPFWLKWFDCADLYPEIGRDSSTYLLKVVPSGWWVRYCWLAWRNPINYFEYKYLGINIQSSYKVTEFIRKADLPNDIGDSTNHVSGWFYLELQIDNKDYYEYYIVIPYKVPFWGIVKCVRFRIGWKFDEGEMQRSGWVQHCLTFNPFAGFSGIK